MGKSVILLTVLAIALITINLFIKTSIVIVNDDFLNPLSTSEFIVFNKGVSLASATSGNVLQNLENLTSTNSHDNFDDNFVYPTSNAVNSVFLNVTKSLPLVLEWNYLNGKSLFDDRVSFDKNCKVRCISSTNRSLLQNAAVIIHMLGGGGTYHRRSRNRSAVHVFLNFEPPSRTQYRNLLPRFFGATITYRQDSTIPVYYDSFVPLDEPNDTDRWTEAEVNAAVKAKEKPTLWIVSHCQTVSAKEEYVAALQKYVNVTQIGGCNHVESPKFQECEKSLMKNHYFYIAFENSVCIDYITEKFFRIRQLIVPIVLDRRVFRGVHERLLNYTIIASDFDSPKQLAEYLQYLIDHPEEYKKLYFEWTKHYKKSEQPFVNSDTACKVCEIANRVYAGTYKQNRVHIHKWWEENICYGRVGNDLLLRNATTGKANK